MTGSEEKLTLLSMRGWWVASLWFLAVCVGGLRPEGAAALPFTVGAPVPIDFERITLLDRSYNVYTLSTIDNTRPSILMGDASFMADQITFDELSGQITALGDVRVTLGPQLLRGDHLEFNVESRRGILTNARMRSSELQVVGGKIEIREIDVLETEGVTQAYSYEILSGSITACEYAIPHYYLEADFFRVVPGARVWLYGAVYRVLGVPIFYFPYLTRSLRKEPFAYVFDPGVDGDKGFVLLNRFHFHYDKEIHPLARGTVYADLYTKQGVGMGARWNYLNQPEAESYLHGYYIDQEDDFGETDEARVNTEGSRGKVAFQHFQRFGPDWTLTGKGRRLSDPDFDEDYRTEEIIRGFSEDELSSDRDAFLNLARRQTNSNMRVIVKKRLEDFNLLEFQEDERTEVVYDSKRRPFTGTDIYHRWKFSAGDYGSHQTTDVGNIDRIDPTVFPPSDRYDADISQNFARANLFGEINRPFNLPELSIIPFASLQLNAYSDATRFTHTWTHQGENDPSVLIEEYDGLVRAIGSAGTEFVTRRELRFDDPALGVERRLLFEPSVKLLGQAPTEDFEDYDPDNIRELSGNNTGGFILSDDPNLSRVDKPGYPYIDDVDSIRDEFLGFEFKLESRFQTRKPGGRVRDWVVGSLSTAVDFTETEEGEEPLSTVFAELFVYPFDWLTYSSYLEYEPQGSYVRSFRNALNWRPTHLVDLGVAYSQYQFDEDVDDPEEEIAFNLNLQLSTRYTLLYTEYYDVDDSLSRRRKLVVSRDFHDWILDVGVHQSERESRDQNTSAFFSLRLKTPKSVEGGVLPVAPAIGGDQGRASLPPRT